MSCHVRAQLVCAAVVLSSLPAQAGPLTIDLPAALARARERAPEAIAAMGRIAEAEATRTGARVLLVHNPELEVGVGPRFGDARTTQIEARIAQPLEPTRRRARIRVADETVRHAHATTDAQLRELSFEVANVFNEARHADLVVELVKRSSALAGRAAEAALRRRKAGDLTDLDVDLAKIAHGRARSAVAAAEAERAAMIGRLAVLIGARPDDTITLAGELRPALLVLDGLRDGVPARADVRALEAEARVAGAERALATAAGRPDVGLWFGYERDDGDSIVIGGVSLTLPLWNRGQGEQAAARAKQRRVEAERTAVIGAASRQLSDVFEAYSRSREAVELFEREVVPALTDSEQLLDRSIEAGQIAVSNYLVARQEILSGRREYLDRQLALAKAAAVARFVAGVSP